MGVLVAVLGVAVSVIAGAGGVQAEHRAGPAPGPLDCGIDKQGVKAAFHEFTAILREGDEDTVRSALEKPRRFAWISAGVRRAHGPARMIISERQPNDAAREVAEQGGLPIVITEFFGVSEPSNWTGSGIRGTWGRRSFVGKTQLNCNKGQATVLGVAINKNRER